MREMRYTVTAQTGGSRVVVESYLNACLFCFKRSLYTRVLFALDTRMDLKCSSVELDANLTLYSRLVWTLHNNRLRCQDCNAGMCVCVCQRERGTGAIEQLKHKNILRHVYSSNKHIFSAGVNCTERLNALTRSAMFFVLKSVLFYPECIAV